jgi:hypothetical protein
MAYVDGEAIVRDVPRVTDADPRAQKRLEDEARGAFVAQSLRGRPERQLETETFAGRLFREQAVLQEANFQLTDWHISEQALKARIAGLLHLYRSAAGDAGGWKLREPG